MERRDGLYQEVHARGVEGSTFRVVSRFDTDRGSVTRFAAQLQRGADTQSGYQTMAQFDHDPAAENGHDIYEEGLHLDIYRRNGDDEKLHPDHPPLPESRGRVLRSCKEYLHDNARWLAQVYLGVREPYDPPRYP